MLDKIWSPDYTHFQRIRARGGERLKKHRQIIHRWEEKLLNIIIFYLDICKIFRFYDFMDNFLEMAEKNSYF